MNDGAKISHHGCSLFKNPQGYERRTSKVILIYDKSNNAEEAKNKRNERVPGGPREDDPSP